MNNLKTFDDFDWKFGFGDKKKNVFGDKGELDPYGEEDWNNTEEFIQNLEFGEVDMAHGLFKILYLKLKPGEYMAIGHVYKRDDFRETLLNTTYLYNIINDNDPIEKQGDHYKIETPLYVGKIPFGEIKSINGDDSDEIKEELNYFLTKSDRDGILIKKIEDYKRSLT